MASSFSQPQAAAPLLDDAQGFLRSATCPMCHTSANMSESALQAGDGWRCVRCGQHWDAERLAAVAAYAAWTVDRLRKSRQGTEGSLPTGPLGGRS